MELAPDDIKNINPEFESSEAIPEFNFPEMKEVLELSEAMVIKMKDKIDAGTWDLLISDEVGGRVPTLVFRSIYKARNPDKDFDTIFVNGGVSDANAQIELVEYLKTKKDKHGETRSHPIFITQFIGSGATVNAMSKLLSEAKVGEGLDIATLTTFFDEQFTADSITPKDIDNSPKINMYIGKDESLEPKFSTDPLTKILTAGVVKPVNTKLPFPIRTEDYITRHHGELVTTYHDLLEVYPNPELSDSQRQDINISVAKARQDIDSIARTILHRVWGKE
jgi:hypothetical protein